MADLVFNVAKGKAAYYAGLPAASDALIVVLLKTVAADLTLKRQDDLAAVLAGGSTEADFTNYGRKTVTAAVTVTVDDVNDRVDVDMPDQTWTTAGGATNNTLAAMLVCYDADTGGGTDANIIPLTKHDFVVTTDASDLTAQIATAGFYRAS